MRGLGAGVFEIALRFRTDAYRVIYAVQPGPDLYILHAFQKKSKSGIKTPREDMHLVKERASKGAAQMSDDDFSIVKGSGTVFRDAPDADTELLKADLSAAILRAQREQGLTNAAAAQKAAIDEGDISRIRHCDLDRFTVDRLVRILNRLDAERRVVVDVIPRSKAAASA